MGGKRYQDENVYEAAKERIRRVFAEFPRICVAFSGGKDSTVLLHLALEVARETDNREVHAMFIDLEAQYAATIAHVEEMFSLPMVVPHWICLPINLRNAVSAFQPYWCAWDPTQQEHWVRSLPKHCIHNPEYYPFYKHRMEFEQFVPAFNEWFAGNDRAAFLVGIRADESLNRYKAVRKGSALKKCAHNGIAWSSMHTRKSRAVSFFPIYDWHFSDIWTYIGNNNHPYNKLYDWMYLTGMPYSEMRICQPYGDDQRKGLDLFHKIEPETWTRVVARVEGANWGAHYCRQKMLGYHGGLGLPPAFQTWQEYANFLLTTMPAAMREVYQRRINVFFDWWDRNGYPQHRVPDAGTPELENKRAQPSWRRVAVSILKMDMGKGLSFGHAQADTARLIETKERYFDL